MKATIRLFKSILTTKKASFFYDPIKDTIEHGFIISPEVYTNFSAQEIKRIVNEVKEI